MSAVPAVSFLTIEEYLEREETALEKHEYYHGEVFAMAGTTIEHNRIVRNTLTALDSFLRDKDCEVFPSDLKVYIEANSLFTYPDLSIICGPLERWNDRNDVITNPAVIIEVLSKSTESYDRGQKFKLYRELPSLREYLLISSTEVLLEHYKKEAPHVWTLRESKERSDALKIETVQFTCPLSEIYRDVSFDPA
jgi:Uma2 family endonuclease